MPIKCTVISGFCILALKLLDYRVGAWAAKFVQHGFKKVHGIRHAFGLFITA
jgi:hypothetical protein